MLKYANGLVPAVIQDEKSGKVLSLYYFNREALQKTRKTKMLWRFSRTLGKVVRKGATSGNTQKVVSISPDCEGKSLLVRVIPNGPACHKGSSSCYGNSCFLFELERVIQKHKAKPQKSSFTAFLLSKSPKLRAKIVEEAFELAAAKSKKEVIWEAADLLYFMLVFCASKKAALDEVCGELERRNSKKSQTPAKCRRSGTNGQFPL